LGFRVKGAEPKQQVDGAEETPVLARIGAYRKFIQENGDKGELAPPSDAPTARFEALKKDAESPGFSRFIAAVCDAGLAFEDDNDIAAFEAAASLVVPEPVDAGNLTPPDWNDFAQMVEDGTLRWNA
jgi:hypothetical protein